jgi:outer membrane protein assembly factor BamB
MRRYLVLAAPAVLAYSLSLPAASAPRPGIDWPQFRGISASGIAEGFSVPATWSLAESTNILWKTDIPGLGHASPVVWGGDVFLSTSISGRTDAGLKVGLYGDVEPVRDDTPHEWRLYAIDKKTGGIKWQRTVHKGVPQIKRHTKATHANSTIATDGVRLITFFGSEGLYAYDLTGKLLWKKDLGVLDAGWFTAPDMQWETGSSPVLHDGKVIVLADVQKNSFLAAFDASSGRELWRTSRRDVPTWGTPTIHTVRGRTQIIVNGFRHAGAYDFETGAEIWKLAGNGDIPIPTPVVNDGLIYLTNAHGGPSPVLAIRDTATGDITLATNATSNDHVA